VLRARTNARHKVEQVVRLALFFTQSTSAPGSVCFVEYDRAKLPLQQATPFLGVAVALPVQQRFDSAGASFQRAFKAVSRTCFDTTTSAASSSLLQTIWTGGMSAISSPTSSKIELRK
jgi:hypothetical protein